KQRPKKSLNGAQDVARPRRADCSRRRQPAMSIERTRQTLGPYLEEPLSLRAFARYLTDDIVVTFMGTDRVITGREAVRTTITFMHQQAFRSHIAATTIVCGEANAMIEARFKGTHVGEFEGI